MSNSNLQDAKKAKNDEFYTQYEDIEKELQHYTEHFEGKTVYCNCDNPAWSNFWQYFVDNFEALRLNRLISTYYEENGTVYKTEKTKEGITKNPLKGNGDFRSEECVELLKEADIVVSNPPFSLWRQYVAQLVEYNKKFIIIGNINAVTYKEVFPLIKDNKMWMGCSIHGGDREFRVPDDYPLKASGYRIDENGTKYIRVKGVRWFTNLDYPQRHEELILYKNYTPEEYPKYDNYDAINIDKTAEIPCDYVPCWFKCNHACDCEYAKNSGFEGQALCENSKKKDAATELWGFQSPSLTNSLQNNSKYLESQTLQDGLDMNVSLSSKEEKYTTESLYEEKCNGAMGVPITFLDKYNPDQFDILNANDVRKDKEKTPAKQHGLIKDKDATVFVKKNFRRTTYARIVVRRVIPWSRRVAY